MNDPFWYDNIDILYKSEKFIEFFPIAEQTIEEKLNAIMRLSIYITILLYISNEYNVKYLFIAITMGLLTIYIYKNQPEIQNIEKSFFDIDNFLTENLK